MGKNEKMGPAVEELRQLVRDAIEKAGCPIVLELKDGNKVRRVRINPDGSIERLWKEETNNGEII